MRWSDISRFHLSAALLGASLAAFAEKPAHFVVSLSSTGSQSLILPIRGNANLNEHKER